MTWGSNPSFRELTCQYCGEKYIDNANPPTHRKICSNKRIWTRFAVWFKERLQGKQLSWLEPAAHNGLVVGSSPAFPTNQNENTLHSYGASIITERIRIPRIPRQTT